MNFKLSDIKLGSLSETYTNLSLYLVQNLIIMPPKQKEVKKGPTYKPSTPFKDMVPTSVKEQPREPKQLKVPEPQGQNTDKNAQGANDAPVLFQQWPAQQLVKAHDFGIASEAKFQDKSHQDISQFLKNQLAAKEKMFNWKYLHQIETLQLNSKGEQESSQEQDELVPKSSGHFQNQPASKNQAEKESINQKMVVIETYMRQQTQQEMQKRKKQEAEKAQKAAKEKKKGKKQQPKDEGPMQVSDVKMSNIISKKSMCPSAIWIGSQLQIIKVRELKDVYTDEPVWKKIYPQQNGVPQITKSGKYWVKLYYMGKPVKIEVDDRVPLSSNMRELFPKSEKNNQKWTLIMTKALIKLFALSNPKASVIGSGLIINALTGMITQNIKIKNFSDWIKFDSLMSNQHYLKKDILVNCFSLDAGKKTPSNFIKNKQQMRDIIVLQNSTFKKKGNRRSSAVDPLAIKQIQEQDPVLQKIEEKYVQANILPGYAYCIGDYFQNKDFNMVYSKQKSLREQKLKVQYNDMSKIVLGNKTRQEKLQHRKKKKQIKEKLLVQQKKRLEQINTPIVKYHFVKLLSDVLINCQYSHKQILLAKKCVLNDLESPPNYDMPNLDKQKQKQEGKPGSTTAIKFKDDAEINAPLDDFSSLQSFKELVPRPEKGVWIKDQDLLTVFDQFQFFFNPNIFEFKSIQSVVSKNPNEFTTDQNKQILVIQKKGNPHLQQQQSEQIQKIILLFGFAFQQSKWDTLCDPYCMLQKFDFQSYRTANNVTTLSSPLSSTYLTINNNNSVFRIYTISRGRYAYWISSDSKYKLLSMADYLTQFEAYTPKTFNIEYPPIEKSTFLTLSRIKIKHENDENNVLFFKIKNCPKDIEKYLSIKIVQIPEDGAYTCEDQEGVIQKKLQNLHLVYEYTRVELLPNKTYLFILEAYPQKSVNEGSIQMVVLSKINQKSSIDQTEQIQPYKVTQKYTPNKYANILKERLFCSNNVNASLLFKVFEGQEGQAVATDKKASKKGGKEEQAFEIIEKQLADKRLVHVKIIKNGNLIYYGKGYNEVIISNVQFEKTNENCVYYLQASFDLRQWPGATVPGQGTNKIYWSVQVTGEDAIAFVKDTLQQQRQKQTRKSWEEKQPGRAQKAKKARQRFLLELKQEKGEALTQQQQQIIKAPKLTKKKLLEQQKKNEDKKGGKGAKKDDKKGAKDKKEQVVEQKQQQRPVPKSEQNFMKEIKQFLQNLQKSKVSKIQLNEGEDSRIRSEQEQNSLKEGAMMSKQNRLAQIIRNIQMRQIMKIKQKDKKDKLTILLEDTRSNFNGEWKKYLQWRAEDQQKDKSKQQKQKALIDIINQEKPTLTQVDLTKTINDYKSIQGHNPKLADVAQMIRKNIKIANMSEKLNNALQGWEVDTLKAVVQQIKNDKVEGLSQQMMSKVNAMMDEASKNPALVAEKQAEIKKTKKGGKK